MPAALPAAMQPVPIDDSASASAERAAPHIAMPDDVLLLRYFSGPWEHPSERRLTTLASTVLFRDGTVVADMNPVCCDPDLRIIRLHPEEMEAVTSRIGALAPITPVDRASFLRFNSGCADAAVQVINVRVGAEPVEVAIYCLYTRLPHRPAGAPESAVELSRILDDLEDLVAARESVPVDRPLPVVRMAPHSGG